MLACPQGVKHEALDLLDRPRRHQSLGQLAILFKITDADALSSDVMVSSTSVRPAIFTVQSAAGGAEAGVE